MIAYTVEIKNLPELQNLYRQAPEIAGKKIIEAGNKSLLSLQATAKQLSPIDSGRLRQSILVSPMQQSGNTFTGSVGTNSTYSSTLAFRRYLIRRGTWENKWLLEFLHVGSHTRHAKTSAAFSTTSARWRHTSESVPTHRITKGQSRV